MNARLLKILNGSEQKYPHALENQFPRVFEKIMSLWDSPGLDACFADLLMTTRSGRKGFPEEVASDIIYLQMLHESKDAPSGSNTWAKALRDDQG
jgi:uncharacterized protein